MNLSENIGLWRMHNDEQLVCRDIGGTTAAVYSVASYWPQREGADVTLYARGTWVFVALHPANMKWGLFSGDISQKDYLFDDTPWFDTPEEACQYAQLLSAAEGE